MQEISSNESTNGQEGLILKQPHIPYEYQEHSKLSLKTSLSMSDISHQFKMSENSEKIIRSSSCCYILKQ